MKKVVRILLAILMVTCLALGITACKSECEKGNHDKYIKSTDEATCTTAEVEHWACHNCDDWTDDVTKGEPLGHDFDAWKPCTDNDAQHQRACKRDGCTVVEKANHAYVDGICVCGKTEGTAPQPCTHPDKDGTNVTEATCTTAKVIHWTCPDCDWTEDETVGNPLGHDYVGQEWKVSGTTHYQECKRDGCNGRNSHTADMSAWAAVGSNHERHCNKDGCTISEEHAADFTDVAWTIADPDNHYKVCPTCGLHGEVAAHNHDKLTKINDNQHSVACSVCSKIFGNENHDWVLDEDKSQAPTCSKEGVNIYVCACGAEKNEPVEKLKHTPEFVITENTHKTVCKVCGETIIAETAHEIVWNNTDKDEHWQYCKICEYEVPNTHAPHSYKEGELICEVCNRTPEGVIVATYYKGEYHRYDTLVEAVASITDSEEAVIYLGKNLEGAGIFIPENRNINFRLQGNTYTVVSGAVGSKNYESQGFHIEKDGNITIQNGTITSKAGSGVKMLVQNYANLTLMNNLVLDGANLDAAYDKNNNKLPNYTLSNNYGETLIRNTTIIPKTEHDVALDVWYGMSSAYYGGVKVTLGVSNTITGIIEYGSAVPVTDWSKVALVMRTNRNHSIRFSGNVPSCEVANITFEDTGEKVVAHMISEGLSYADGHHFHECTRCHAHVDETECTRETVPGRAATCTLKGITDGVKCSVCGSAIVEQKEIPALGHDFGEAYVSISDTQHAHQCSRCGGYDTPVNHTYVANHCEACGKELTQAEVIELLKSLVNDGDVLVSADSTFALVGFYGGKISNYNYALNDEQGAQIIACFDRTLDPSQDLIIGDKISVTGKIKNYKGTIEFDGFTYVLVKRGSSEITIDYNEDQIESVQFLDKDGNVIDAVGGKFTAERGTDVSVTIVAKQGFVVDGVTVNGVEIEIVDGKYTFEVTTENVLKILSRNPNALPDHNASGQQTEIEITNTDELKIGAAKTDYTADNNSGSGKEYLGFTFDWAKIIRSGTGFQMNGKNANGKGGYIQISASKKVIGLKISVNNLSNISVSIIDENGVKTELDIKKSDELTQISGNAKIIRIDAVDGSGSATITSITVICDDSVPCTNSKNPQHFEANPATCTTDGNVEYWKCLDCNKYFIKNEAGKFVEVAQSETVIKAGHTFDENEWQHGKVEIEGKEVFAHWHACANCEEKIALAACVGEVKADTAVSATCTTAGKEADKVCGVCGQTVEVGAEIVALGHDYSYEKHVDGTHTATCQRDGCDSVLTNVPCSAADDAEWKHDENNHWKLCVCANEVEKGAHSFENGECTVCHRKEGVANVLIDWSVSLNTADGEKLSEDKVKLLISNYITEVAAEAEVKFAINTTISINGIDEFYRVVSVSNACYIDDAVMITPVEGQYSFTAGVELGNVIEIVVVRQYTVSLSSDSAEGINVTATLNGGESVDLSATVDDGTEVTLIISLGSLADTKVISGVTYTVEGGNAVSILNADGTVKNFNVTGNISICVTLSDKPNDTTVEQSTFSAISGNVGGDSNVTYTSAKGGGTSDPFLTNEGIIRLYQNSNGSGGGTITIAVPQGKQIISIKIGSAQGTLVAYTTSSDSVKTSNQSLEANGNIEWTFEDGITSVTIYCMGTTKNQRLEVNHLSVTYA